jgi:hypothetical protein
VTELEVRALQGGGVLAFHGVVTPCEVYPGQFLSILALGFRVSGKIQAPKRLQQRTTVDLELIRWSIVSPSWDYRRTIERPSHKLGTNNGLAMEHIAMDGATLRESASCVKTEGSSLFSAE